MNQTIQLSNGNQLIVSQVPLGKYAEILKSFQELPKYLDQIAGKSNDQLLALLPEIIAGSSSDFIRLFSLATPLTEQEATNLALIDAINVFIAIYEVNQYKEAWDKVKKIFPQPAANQAILGSSKQ